MLLTLVLAPGSAGAVTSLEHEPGGDSCAQAGTYFPEDQSDEAQRARLGCRRELFARQLEQDRERQEAATEDRREQNLEAWMRKQDVPVRAFRRNAVDFFGSGGLMSYGIASTWLLLPELDAELWWGRRNTSGYQAMGNFQDSRSCIGARLKWLMRSKGNLTPLASLGAADCWANVALESFGFSNGPGDFVPPSNAIGTATAHVATATLGLTWMHSSGLRASFEYLYSYAFYTQATDNDEARTLDAGLRAYWEQRLTSDRGGVRLQVGYAF